MAFFDCWLLHRSDQSCFDYFVVHAFLNCWLLHVHWSECILVPMSESERGRLDARNIVRVVSEITCNGCYRVATRHGIINTSYCRNQIMKASSQLLTLEDTSQEVHSARKVASLDSATDGQGYTKCSCATACSTRRRAWRKSGTLCHSHCHPRNAKCKNK